MKRILLMAVLSAAVLLGQKAAPKVPAPKDLKYPPLSQVKIPVPVEATLSNGMKVFLLEDHELPLVSGLALVKTGNLFDPADKRGLADVTATVLRSGGTRAKSGDQIDEELENIAASVEAGMDETSASVSFSGLKESAPTLLKQFKEILSDPEFRQDKVDLVLTQYKSSIARRNDEAGGIPSRELSSILYGRDNSYGWQIEYEHLNNIKRDDLIAFYRRYYFPKNIMLAVYGDFSPEQMKQQLEAIFADWKVEQQPVPAFPSVTAKPAPGIYLGEKEDVTQTFFSIGHLGGTLRDPDYAALEVTATILGQGFSSRLMSQVRTKLGYAYSIGASWSAQYNHPGTFRIGGSTKSASTVDALKAIRVELDKIRTAEVTPRELAEAKEGVLNSFVFNFDSPSKTLSRALRYEYYGYPKDFLMQYQKAISAVTQADVLRVAKQHFRPDDLTIVAVGNPKAFGKPLSELGKVSTLDLTIPEPKQEVAAGDASSQGKGKQLLERAREAMGGTAKLAAIRDAVQDVDVAMETAAGGMKIKQNISYLAPNFFRQEQVLPFGKIIAYTDGATGWLATPQGVMNMPAEVLKQAQGELFRQLIALVLSDRDESRTVNATGPAAVQISSAQGQLVTLEFDAAGLPASETYQSPGMGGAPTKVSATMADWKDVDGIKMPFKITLEQDGKKVAEAIVSGYKFNSGLTAEAVGKKP